MALQDRKTHDRLLLDRFLETAGAPPATHRVPPGQKPDLLKILDHQLEKNAINLAVNSKKYPQNITCRLAPAAQLAMNFSSDSPDFDGSIEQQGARFTGLYDKNPMQNTFNRHNAAECFNNSPYDTTLLQNPFEGNNAPARSNTSHYNNTPLHNAVQGQNMAGRSKDSPYSNAPLQNEFGRQNRAPCSTASPYNMTKPPQFPVSPFPNGPVPACLIPTDWVFYCPDCELIIDADWLASRTVRKRGNHADVARTVLDVAPKFGRRFDFYPTLMPVQRRFCTLCVHRSRMEQIEAAAKNHYQGYVNIYGDKIEDLVYRTQAWGKERLRLVMGGYAYDMSREEKGRLRERDLLGRKYAFALLD